MTTLLTTPRTSLAPSDMRPVVEESQDLVDELRRVVTGEVRFDGFTRMLYSTDASLYKSSPSAWSSRAAWNDVAGYGGDRGGGATAVLARAVEALSPGRRWAQLSCSI